MKKLLYCAVLGGLGWAGVVYWSGLDACFCRRPVVHAQDPAQLGGDIVPVRQVSDPYPVFNGIAVDAQNNVVAMSDVNRKGLLSYDRSGKLRQQIYGPETNMGFVAGVALDPQRGEIFAVNNDIEDTLVVMPYQGEGNLKPSRLLSVPHQSWGLALGHAQDQIAVTVEMQNSIVFYARDAQGVVPPLRVIRGESTGLADPHGIYWDERHNEIGVANHGNFRGLVRDIGSGCVPTGTADVEGAEFRPPSISIYADDARGNQKPLRVIQGSRTKLDFPMGAGVDPAHDEIVVANNGDSSVLVFRREAGGDVAPVRILSGARTGINHPMGIAVDAVNDEIWVSNFGDHTALVFDRSAKGNVAPKRVIRTAPVGTPSPGFGNPETVAYDGKREQILVPN